MMYIDAGKKVILFAVVLAASLIAGVCIAENTPKPGRHVSITPGSVNSVVIESGGANVVIYGDPNDMLKEAVAVLFTHSRRDVVWAGRKLVENGAMAIVPAGEVDKFTEADGFWREFAQKRYHDYAQQTTKIITRPMRIGHAAKGGESFDVHGIDFEVIDTPGYTRGAVSYLTKIDGVSFAFVGDLIYGDGQLLDLYSLQDAVAEAKIGGYHGWAGRMGELIQSLRKVAAKKCDILVPARGPVVNNPQQAIEKLIARLQAVYRNYLSISAGRWYFKEHYDTLAARVLGPDGNVDWMKWAVEINKQPPAWIVPIANSRLVMADDGRGFLIDCGGANIIRELQKRRSDGRLKALDGLFITHYHDDHTNAVGDLLKEFPCPVYACEPLVQILRSPWAFRLPAMTAYPIADIKTMRHKQKMRWKEFDLTFYDFPGQTIYHDAVLVEKEDAEKIFFIGDSFTPSGLDDYCLLNRNILYEKEGYFYCLDILRTMPPETLLINQHVVETFAFSQDQVNGMTWILEQRRELMKQLFPWDNPNFGIDERWARFYPYGLKTHPGGTVEMAINILNHSDDLKTFTVRPNAPAGLQCTPADVSLHISPHREKHVDFRITVEPDTPPGVYVITADIAFDNRDFKQWCEGLIEVAAASPIDSRPGE